MTETGIPLNQRLNDMLPGLQQRVARAEPRLEVGRVRRVSGIMVYASLPMARIGELCYLRDPVTGRQLPAEVVGFAEQEAILTPIGDLNGMSTRAEVIPSGTVLQVPVGDPLLGKAINALGEWLDGPAGHSLPPMARCPVQAEPPSAFHRQLIDQPLSLGIRAIDGLLTLARGQRMGLFGEAGVGKSSLLASMVRGTEADVVVLALIGERGREVRELLERHLDPEARARTIAVVATSDRPAMERIKAAYVATALAEHFRDRGRHVLLLMDSVTRFARAQREIGLAAGEPPTRRGYPPSFFAALPRLLERAGPGSTGSITGIYTVLTEGEGSQDPVAEEAMSILDGHIVLSRDLAQRNHFPAIDVLRSRSRLMNDVTRPRQQSAAARIRELMARYQDVELLLQVGEYTPGHDADTDAAITRKAEIDRFLRQPPGQYSSLNDTLHAMAELTR